MIPLPDNLTKQRQGDAVEHLFRGHAQLRGVRLFVPAVDDKAIDFCFIKGGQLRGIQVKSTRYARACGTQKKYVIDVFAKTGPGSLENLDSTFVSIAHVFVIYLLPENAWFLIPRSEVVHLRSQYSLTIYPDGSTTDRNEKWRDRWDLLLD